MADETAEAPPADETQGEPALGDAGKKALEAERETARAAEKARKAAEKRASELESRLAQFEEQSKSDTEKALDAARREAADAAKAEVLTELHRERVNNALMRHSAKFADPEDVLTIADEIEVGADGRPDPREVEVAVTKLLERKPHWAATGRKFGDVGQGPRDEPHVQDNSPRGLITAGLAASQK